MIQFLKIDSFFIGPFQLYTWGIFVALAFLIGLILAVSQAGKVKIEINKLITLAILVYLGAMVGARLFFILQWPVDFLNNPLEFFKFPQGGLMFYGGLLGGILAGFLYMRKWGNRRVLIDSLIPIVALSMAVARIGCFLTNDHQGAVTSLFWAIKWPDGVLRHPVALYLVLFDLALAGLLFLFRKRTHKPGQVTSTSSGQVFLMFLILYSVGRFLLDFTREANSFLADPHYLSLAVSQWISIFLLAGTIVFLFLKREKSVA